MKKARMNISRFRFILFNLKIFGEIVTTIILSQANCRYLHAVYYKYLQIYRNLKLILLTSGALKNF